VKFAGHCLRAEDQPVKDLVLWSGIGKGRRGNFKTFPKILCSDLAERFGTSDRFAEYDMEEIKQLAIARDF